MVIQDLHPNFFVPGRCPQNACSKVKPPGVSVHFCILPNDKCGQLWIVPQNNYEKCNFIRLAKLEHIREESWSDIRKQLREITDSLLVNKTRYNLT